MSTPPNQPVMEEGLIEIKCPLPPPSLGFLDFYMKYVRAQEAASAAYQRPPGQNTAKWELEPRVARLTGSMLRPVHIGPDPYSEIDLDDWSSPERTAHLERNVYLTAVQVAEAELLAAVAKDMNSKANQMPK